MRCPGLFFLFWLVEPICCWIRLSLQKLCLRPLSVGGRIWTLFWSHKICQWVPLYAPTHSLSASPRPVEFDDGNPQDGSRVPPSPFSFCLRVWFDFNLYRGLSTPRLVSKVLGKENYNVYRKCRTPSLFSGREQNILHRSCTRIYFSIDQAYENSSSMLLVVSIGILHPRIKPRQKQNNFLKNHLVLGAKIPPLSSKRSPATVYPSVVAIKWSSPSSTLIRRARKLQNGL